MSSARREMIEDPAGARQAAVSAHTEELARIVREAVSASLGAWQQLPLVAALGMMQPGSGMALSQVAGRGVWPLHVVRGSRLQIRCRDGGVLTESGEEASTYQLALHLMALEGELGAFQGGKVLVSAREMARRSWGERHWQQTGLALIARSRVGFVAGWEEMHGPIHDASELLVGLAGSWEGCTASLISAAASGLGDAVHPEVGALQVVNSSLAPHLSECECRPERGS